MANRFRNRNYGRGDYGNRSDYGRGRYGSDYDFDRNYGSSPRFGGYDYDREENYFGGGNMSYGQGYTGTDFDRGYSSYNRDFEEDNLRFNQPSRNYTGYSGRSYRNYDRDNYYGGGFRTDYDRSEYGQNDYDRNYGGDYYMKNNYGNDRSYGSDYMNDNRYYNRSNRGGYDYDRNDYDYDRENRGFFEKAGDEVASWFGDEEARRRRRMDERQNHRGRGPRNYTRSDDRIKEDINDRLTDDYYLDASDINVEVNNGEVTLTGTVDTRYAKRHAEDIAEDVSGVTHMENRIRVNESFYGQGDSSVTSKTNETTAASTTDTTTAKSRSKTA